MIKLLKPYNDTYINSNVYAASYDLDTFLELKNKKIDNNSEIVYSLLSFNRDIFNQITMLQSQYDIYLKFYAFYLNDIIDDDKIKIEFLSKDYEVGYGDSNYEDFRRGCTWKYNKLSSKSTWNNLGGDVIEDNNVVAEYKIIDVCENFFNQNSLYKVFKIPLKNQINNYIQNYYNDKKFFKIRISLIPNNEFLNRNKIIKIVSLENYGNFTPRLELCINDYVYETNSNYKAVNNENYDLTLYNFNGEVKTFSSVLFKVFCFDEYENKIEDTTYYFENKKIPLTYYSIIDEITKFPVIDFSEYTKVSHTKNLGNYFLVDFSNFNVGYYKILFKTYFNDTFYKIIDSGYTIKVTN